MRLILPVQPLDQDLAAGFDLSGQLPHAQKQLVHHSAFIEEDQVKHQAQRRCGDHDRKEVYGPEKLCSHADRIHQQRQYQSDSDLKHNGAYCQKQGVFQRRSHIRICPKPLIVFIPRLVQSLCRTAKPADLHKGIDDILKEGIIQIDQQEEKGRNQEQNQRTFLLVDHGTHAFTALHTGF